MVYVTLNLKEPMFFYILIAAILVLTIASALLWWILDLQWPATAAITISLAATVVWLIFLMGHADTGPTLSEVRHPLKAISTTDSVNGHLYLGGGYIDGQKTLSFIEQKTGKDGTWSVVDSAYASDSRIFESDGTPYLLVRTIDLTNYLLTPWRTWTHDVYDFHVPAGSVQSNYEVTAK